jgi:hypothetical protein
LRIDIEEAEVEIKNIREKNTFQRLAGVEVKKGHGIKIIHIN